MTVDPTTLPGWRILPGLALAVDGTPGRVSLGTGGLLLWNAEGGPGYIAGIDRHMEAVAGLQTFTVLAADPATSGVLVHLLGPEAWRVRYSPSQHKQAAGTPWVADLVGTVTLHPSQGEAAAAVAGALGRWGGA